MLATAKQNPEPFAYKVRVRACGLLIEKQQVLLIKHKGIGKAGFLWSPPGGGVEFGQSLEKTLKREFLEETNLSIQIVKFLFTNEHIDGKHHALEFFFAVIRKSGVLQLGSDPELDQSSQILEEARFFGESDLKNIPQNAIHSAFRRGQNIMDLRGLLTFESE
ncbi:MAG: NUDIX hydrolase [Bacteroidota bacterium]